MSGYSQANQFDRPWKLAAFYFFFFAVVGGIAPYLPLFLSSLGYDAIAVGQLMAIVLLTKLVAPNFWGWLADKSGRRLTLVRIGGMFSSLLFVGFIVADSFWSHALYLVLFSCFWNAVLPQWEVITLHNLGSERSRYGRIRLWGSVGFIFAVTGLGWFFETFAIHWLVYWLLIFLLCMTLFSLLAEHQPDNLKGGSFSGFYRHLFNRNIMLFFTLAFLLQLSFGPYYTFLSLYLEDLGYSKIAIGLLWAVAVVAEVILFFVMHRLIQRVALKWIVLICLLFTSMRWFGIGHYAHLPWVLLTLQLLHAASFGGLHASSIEFVHRAFPAEYAGQGQALYSALSFGAGGGLGAWSSGLIVDGFGKAAAFQIAAIVALTACFLLLAAWSFLSRDWSKISGHH